MPRTVTVRRPTHTVTASGEDVVHLEFDIDTDLYGDPWMQLPHKDSLLGELDPPFSIAWTFEMNRVQPHSDDQYPMSMPDTIANIGIRAAKESPYSPSVAEEVEAIDIQHLNVNPRARRMGYGQLLWDVYVAIVAYGDYRAEGGVGSTRSGATVAFLREQGVPMSDISPGARSPQGGEGLVKWDTAPSNITGSVIA